MYMHMCMYVHTYIYIYIYIYVCASAFACVYIFVCVYMFLLRADFTGSLDLEPPINHVRGTSGLYAGSRE